MRKINKAGLNLIQKHEGYSESIYLDCAGFLTIGYGHLCRDGDEYLNGLSLREVKKRYLKNKKKVQENIKITLQQAENILKKDLSIAEKAVDRLIKAPLTDNQFAAIVSFTFNLGSGALQRSTLRQKLNRKEYKEIPSELNKWVYAGGRKFNGLVRRRREEGLLFIS
jgi:lysozyme